MERKVVHPRMKTTSNRVHMRIDSKGTLGRGGDRREKITLLVPVKLKQRFEEMAEARQTTLTHLISEALEFHVENEPPTWFVNVLAGRKPRREPSVEPLEIQLKLAKRLVLQSSAGIDTAEVARETGQTVPEAFATLTKLSDDGMIVAHGRRSRRVWTPPGMTPASRISVFMELILKIFAAAETIDQMTVNEKIAELINANRWKIEPSVMAGRILRTLVRRRLIRKVGISERGTLYEFVRATKGDSNAKISN
jgi:hypothetical protein